MKLLIFSPYYPPHVGGLESHADEFNKYMSPHVEKILVFTPKLPVEAPGSEIRYGNVEVIRFPAFELIPNYPLPKFWDMEFWKLFSDLYKENFTAVISRTRFFSTSLLALFFAKTKKVKWMHIEHGSDFVKLHSKLASFIARLYDYTFGRIVLLLSNKNIANSKASASFCKRLSFNRECEVIYRGVEIEKIESVEPNLGLKQKNEGKTIITFIGRLIDGKGVHDLLEAVKDIHEDFVVLIIGDGPQRENLKNLAGEYGVKEKVVFFGQKKFEDAIAILKISDIFVNPSYTEGLPTSVIEAGLCKIPIVATNVGGTPEISNKLPLITTKDTKKIKIYLTEIINKKVLYQDKSDLIYNEIKEKFDWNVNIKKYLRIIKS